MIFAHDTEVALAAAAALVNTGRGRTEQLPDTAALDSFTAAWGWTGERTHDQAELDAVRQLRPRLERLRLCAADDCDNVHVDLSKNRSRRFCGTLCANRTNVAAYRTRHAARAGTGTS